MARDRIAELIAQMTETSSRFVFENLQKYLLWKRILVNNPSTELLEQVAVLLAYHEYTPVPDNYNQVHGPIPPAPPKEDVLTVLYTKIPQGGTHIVAADCLELAILRWAGVALNKDEAKTLLPTARVEVGNAILDEADIDGFMHRPGYSKTKADVRSEHERGGRLVTEESVRKMLERRKGSEGAIQTLAEHDKDVAEWLRTLSQEERLDLLNFISRLKDAMSRKKNQKDT